MFSSLLIVALILTTVGAAMVFFHRSIGGWWHSEHVAMRADIADAQWYQRLTLVIGIASIVAIWTIVAWRLMVRES